MTTELKLPDFESWTDAQIDAFTDKVIEALDKLPEEGVPGHVYSREEVETLYAAGYQLYRQGDLKNSTAIFEYLCIHENDDARFWTALAVAMQKQKKWDPAIDAYSMAALLDATNVSLYLYATECLMASRQWSRAKQSLDAFFTVCGNVHGDGDKPEVRPLIDKAEVWKDVIKSKLAGAAESS